MLFQFVEMPKTESKKQEKTRWKIISSININAIWNRSISERDEPNMSKKNERWLQRQAEEENVECFISLK